jgi:hypothetical protein
MSSFNEKVAQLHLDFLSQAADFTPTDEEYVAWVDSYLVAMRPALYMMGPQQCWNSGSASFRAWVLETRGISISDYMVKRLTTSEYLRWVERFATPTLAPDGPIPGVY